jgi:endonuclease/exonuclease/phosphatase family metal-dependent hydrolase
LLKSDENKYLILTLNLHTYQESDQHAKLQKIIVVIGEMDIDIIAFQECAQHRNVAPVGGTGPNNEQTIPPLGG